MPIARFQLPDGRVARFEVPEGTSPEQAQAMMSEAMSPKGMAVDQTNPSQLKGSSVGGVAMGLRDPVDAGAQMLRRLVPEGLGNAIDAIGNKAADMGFPVARSTGVQGVDQIAANANQEYEQSRQMAGRDGIDLARIGGNIANPINRIVPMGGAASTAGVAARAGAQGAVSGLFSPVSEGQNFWETKAQQAGVGALAGAVGGAAIDKLAQGIGNVWAQIRRSPAMAQLSGKPAQQGAAELVGEAARRSGVDLSQIPEQIKLHIVAEADKALQTGKMPDMAAVLRQAEGKAVLGDDAALTLGQATRDPQLFTRDIDLRGISGAGKPIADRLNLQNQRLIEKVGSLGAKGAPDAYDAGSAGLKSLKAYDEKLSAGVREAYTKFRGATGATVDVPMEPLAQRLGEVVEKYGEANVPAAVRAQLGSYGLGGMKQTKVFDLLEADKLIKTINANMDPMKGPEMAALGELRSGLNDAIKLAAEKGDQAAGPAADLLKTALKTASERFSLHEKLPALADAVKNPKAQERFVRDYVTSKSASVDTVNLLAKTLDPNAMDAVRRNVLADVLEKAAPGAGRGSDAAGFSQAGYNNALDAIGERKLATIFGADGAAKLRQIGRVAEWAQKQPKGSAVNNSNSGAAVMNLLQGLAGKSDSTVLNKLSGLPMVNIARDSLGKALDEAAVSKSLAAQIPKASPKLSEAEVNALRAYLPLVGGAAGVTAASGFR